MKDVCVVLCGTEEAVYVDGKLADTIDSNVYTCDILQAANEDAPEGPTPIMLSRMTVDLKPGVLDSWPESLSDLKPYEVPNEH